MKKSRRKPVILTWIDITFLAIIVILVLIPPRLDPFNILKEWSDRKRERDEINQ